MSDELTDKIGRLLSEQLLSEKNLKDLEQRLLWSFKDAVTEAIFDEIGDKLSDWMASEIQSMCDNYYEYLLKGDPETARKMLIGYRSKSCSHFITWDNKLTLISHSSRLSKIVNANRNLLISERLDDMEKENAYLQEELRKAEVELRRLRSRLHDETGGSE